MNYSVASWLNLNLFSIFVDFTVFSEKFLRPTYMLRFMQIASCLLFLSYGSNLYQYLCTFGTSFEWFYAILSLVKNFRSIFTTWYYLRCSWFENVWIWFVVAHVLLLMSRYVSPLIFEGYQWLWRTNMTSGVWFLSILCIFGPVVTLDVCFLCW